MNPKIKSILFLFTPILIYSSVIAFDRETEKVMPFISSKSFCSECHQAEDSKFILQNLTNPCDYLCNKCHKGLELHHKVGMKLAGRLSRKFYLTRKKKIACFTCHDLKTKRYDNTSWRAESLFENIFRKKTKYKTYYLVIKNTKGQLCKKCH